MALFADAILAWLALQAPVGILLGRRMRRQQPPAAPAPTSFPTTPEESTHA